MNPGEDRIAQLDAEIAALYREVGRLEGECESVSRGKETDRHIVLDIRSRMLRERARTLDAELSRLLDAGSFKPEQ